MTHTNCMTSYCALAEAWACDEDDPGKNLLSRAYGGFSEERIGQLDSTTTCPYFTDQHDAAGGQERLH